MSYSIYERNKNKNYDNKNCDCGLPENHTKLETREVETMESGIPPESFEREILDKIKYKIQGKSVIIVQQLYFIDGLIRKYKPKKNNRNRSMFRWNICSNFKCNK